MDTKSSTSLPPGFRFHPTDEELIIYYLRNQAKSRPCPVSIIPEIEIYKFDPWELPDKTEFGEKEWYFFSPRDRKYPNGARPNRATASGYWKATGTDKAIHSGAEYVGVKKSLVFYKGRPPKGVKTDWIMHEYRLNESSKVPRRVDGSMRLDDWVLCRIYKKRQGAKVTEEKIEEKTSMDVDDSDQQSLRFPRPYSFSHLLEFDYMAPLLNDNGYESMDQFQIISSGNGIEDMDMWQLPNTAFPLLDTTELQVQHKCYVKPENQMVQF